MRRLALLACLAAIGLPLASASGSRPTARPILAVSGWDVVTIRPDGSGVRSLTPGPKRESEAAWSPFGELVAYWSQGDGLWVMAANGLGKRRLATGNEQGLSPNSASQHYVGWAGPSTVLFVPEVDVIGRGDIHVARSDGSRVANLTRGKGPDSWPIGSPDGRRIAFVRSGGRPGLYVMNADGSGQRRIARALAPRAVAWAPDGRHLVFESANRAVTRFPITIAAVDGGAQRVIATNPVAGSRPNFAPDGRTVVFSSIREGTSFDVYRVRSDGSGLRNLTRDGDFAESDPTWSWDGRQIAYLSAPASGTRRGSVHVMSADGTNGRRLTRPTFLADLTWATTP